MLMLQSVHTSWAEKEEDGKGWNQHASLHLALICKTSPSKMICESGATHSVPHPVAESASLGEVLFPRSHGHDYVIGPIFHMLFARKIFHQCQKHDVLQNYCSVDQKPRAFHGHLM